jgi:hypothetical protein
MLAPNNATLIGAENHDQRYERINLGRLTLMEYTSFNTWGKSILAVEGKERCMCLKLATVFLRRDECSVDKQ